MKTKIALALALLMSTLSFAQQGINYKAVIKDNLGNVVANQSVTVQFAILKGASQSNVYTENQTKTTDANGIVIMNIGEGTPVSGTYTSINWGSDTHYLNLKVNKGSGLIDMGTTQFMAVPYSYQSGVANYANNAGSVVNGVEDLNDLSDAKTKSESLFLGINAGLNVDIATQLYNTGVGLEALKTNTSGSRNAAFGYQSLTANTSGSYNTGLGTVSLFSNTTGSNNTATGHYAMRDNTRGADNTANGYYALRTNTGGDHNAAFGSGALYSNTSGSFNTATGFEAMYTNTSGIGNTANGYKALQAITNGQYNTAIGRDALSVNTTGDLNTAVGNDALKGNTTGNNNTGVGYNAGIEITTGSKNTAIGWNAQVPNATGSNQVRIGDTKITYAGVQVAWTITSDRRLKSNIQSSNLGLAFIKALKPVVYERKNDRSKKTEYGFIAQEVEVALKQFGVTNNGLINVADDGMYSLRYNDLIVVLTKAMQEQQEVIDSLQSSVGSLQSAVGSRDSKIEDLTAELEENLKASKEFDTRLKQLENIFKTIDQ